MVSKWIVWGEAVSCLHNQAPNLNTMTSCDGIHWHQVQWHTTCIDSVSARAAQLEDGWSPNELCEGEQSHAYINQAPNLNTIDSLWWNYNSHQVQWHYYVYWFCECQSWRTGDGWSPNELCEGEQFSCLHNQAPNLNTIDFLRWNTLTSGTVTFLRVLICECQSWRLGDDVSTWCVGTAVSCFT